MSVSPVMAEFMGSTKTYLAKIDEALDGVRGDLRSTAQAQGERTGRLEADVKTMETQIWAKLNQIDQKLSDNSSNGAGNGRNWKKQAQTAAPWVGAGGGSIIFWETIKAFAAHLK